MKIEITDQQEREVRQGRPVKVVDPRTRHSYILFAPEQYERVQAVLAERHPAADPGVAPGIRASQEAYWRDLPRLVKLRSEERQWVAYAGNERVGFGRTMAELYEACERRGLSTSEFYVDRLEPRPLPPWESETIEAPFDPDEPTDPAS